MPFGILEQTGEGTDAGARENTGGHMRRVIRTIHSDIYENGVLIGHQIRREFNDGSVDTEMVSKDGRHSRLQKDGTWTPWTPCVASI